MPGGASILRSAGAPDTLQLSAWSMNLGIALRVAYTGPGTYVLGPAEVDLLLLVGGDGKTGGYRGSASTAGELVVTQPGGSGAPIRAEFWFDADHVGGEQRFGSVASFRSGLVTAPLSVYSR